MSDLKTYLASKYMSGPKADAILAHAGVDKKKRRKKPKNEDYIGGSGSSGSGLILKDEDQWGSKRKDDIDLDGDDAPVIGKDIASFKKGQSQWSTVGSTALPVRTRVKSEPRDSEGESPAPTSAAEDSAEAKPKPQLTKRRGGLRTAAQMAEEAARAAAEAKARSPSLEPDAVQQTVHRDRSGRVLDVEQLKADARREELEEKLKAEERKEWTKGFVQREGREQAARELKRMEGKDVARYADDEDMNREQREVERWNDPAAAFLTKSSKKSKTKGPRYKVYKGSWSENRFGIRPGCRWDGVDRGNGFEKKWIMAQNAAARREYEGNQMDMEDL